MKKSVIICILFYFCGIFAFGLESKIQEQLNEYGGVTEEFNLTPHDSDYSQFTKVEVYYDNYNLRVKRRFYFSEELQKQWGQITLQLNMNIPTGLSLR